MEGEMKIAYADPPYLGCSHYYPEHQEVDHDKLIEDLCWNYDYWALSCSSPSLGVLLNNIYLTDRLRSGVVRVGAWVKPFCSFKPNVNPGYAWEPVIFKGREKRTRDIPTVRDWVAANITLKKGLVGAKPTDFCYWLFDLLGASADDEFVDIFPGTGIVSTCWESWCKQKKQTQEVMELSL
jgi:hypothetical protein